MACGVICRYHFLTESEIERGRARPRPTIIMSSKSHWGSGYGGHIQTPPES